MRNMMAVQRKRFIKSIIHQLASMKKMPPTPTHTLTQKPPQSQTVSNLISLSCSRNIAEAAKIPSWLYPCITPRSVTVAKTSSNVFVEEGEVGTAGTGGGGGGLQRKKVVSGHNTTAHTDRGVYWMGAGEVGAGEGEREKEGREGGERRGWAGGDWGGGGGRGGGGVTDRVGLETQTRMTATWRQPFEQPGPSPLHKQTVFALLLLRSSCLPPSYHPPPPPTPIQRPSHAFPSSKPSLFLLSHLLISFSFPRLFFNQPFGPTLLFIHCTDEACRRRELVS